MPEALELIGLCSPLCAGEWPTDFTNETIPDLVDIWFKPLPERRAFECDGDDYV